MASVSQENGQSYEKIRISICSLYGDYERSHRLNEQCFQHNKVCEQGWDFIPTPMTTRKAVQNRPKSTIALPELSMKSSGFEHRLHIQFGNGARMYVATTRRGRYSCHKAQDRMTRRKPIASIWASYVSIQECSKLRRVQMKER